MDLSTNPTYVHGFRDEVNLRDLGGERNRDGLLMKRQRIFRSGALGNLNEQELIQLRRLQLRYVLDLRSASEAGKTPDPIVPGAQQVRICGATDRDGHELDLSPAGIVRLMLRPRARARITESDLTRVPLDIPQPSRPGGAIVARVTEIYASMAFDNAAYRELFHQLEAGNVPLLFHCSAGKDRTGVAAMLILLALGFDSDAVVDRYVLTNQYRSASLSRLIDGHSRIMSRIPKLRLAALASSGVVREFGEGALEAILHEYGTYEAYFEQEYGLDEARIAELREKYLEPPAKEGRE